MKLSIRHVSLIYIRNKNFRHQCPLIISIIEFQLEAFKTFARSLVLLGAKIIMGNVEQDINGTVGEFEKKMRKRSYENE